MALTVGGVSAGGGAAKPASPDEQAATIATNWAQRNKINLRIGKVLVDGKGDRAALVDELKSLQIPAVSLNKALIFLGLQAAKGTLKLDNNEINVGDLMKNLAANNFFSPVANKSEAMSKSLAAMNLILPGNG